MTEKPKGDRHDVVAAVMRLLTRVPDAPPPADDKPRWYASEKKTPPDSFY